MRKPRALREGDRVAIVAPASGCDRAIVERGAAELRRLGFVPVVPEATFDRDVFTAGSPARRARALLDAWQDPDVAALIALRGGYGSAHLLPALDAIRALPPKLFIGYSDTTALLSWLTCRAGITALHGPMIEGRLSEGPGAYDERSLRALLQGGRGLSLRPDGLDVLRAGDAEGPLVGGTLTQLTASLGTPFAFDPPEGCVLFLEDVNERPYRLHRMLTHLAQAGVLERAQALVFGEMRGCDEPDGRVTARSVAADLARDLGRPVLFGFPSGHTTGPCWTLPFGVRVRVTTATQPGLVVEEAAVAQAERD